MAEREVRVLVGIETNGRKCGRFCRLLVPEDDRGNGPYCAGFGSVRPLKTNGQERFRNPDCIAAEKEARRA